MKQNKYDEAAFYAQYSKMLRSTAGLEGAGEWHELKKVLPDFNDKKVLDLGCGFGWHCRYATEQGAKSVLGVDISAKMLQKAQEIGQNDRIEYLHSAIEDVDFSDGSFDIILSSLAFHYIESFQDICQKAYKWLKPGGEFIFSVEHPVFTAFGNQDWHYDKDGKRLHWPVDHYYKEGRREASFLGESVIKYHKTLTTYIQSVLSSGFEMTHLIEPQPEEKWLTVSEEMKDELRRPLFLIISARKK